MPKIRVCGNCAAINDPDRLVCWICNCFLDGKILNVTKNSKAIESLKSSKEFNDDTRYAKINFHKSGIEGYVYLLKGTNYYKIGKSKSLTSRTKTLKIQLPFKCFLVHAIKTNNISSLEKYWHKKFSKKRTNGEWFSLNKDDINEFIRSDSLFVNNL